MKSPSSEVAVSSEAAPASAAAARETEAPPPPPPPSGGQAPGPGPLPRTDLRGLVENWRPDVLSGFLVFLIALPLCLGIAMASGYPPIAGIFTSVIGGLVCTWISDSQLTIKGPAAGLIVIVLGAVQDLGGGDPLLGYKLALGVGVIAAVLQMFFGLVRTGVLAEFFPMSAVHGMLAAIGIIIAAKQMHVVLGVTPKATGPLALIRELPHSIANANAAIAAIGLSSLVLLFLLPLIKNSHVKRIPPALMVLTISVPLGLMLGLGAEHKIWLFGHSYTVGPKFLVDLPTNLIAAITYPDFSAVLTGMGIKYIIMFALVGYLESLLSAKAIDLLDPWKRNTNLNRDLVAVGTANLVSSAIGGMPMISAIVRSSANINSGGRTRFAGLYHSLFLLACVWAIPGIVHQIPLAALAAMLVYTGYRLAAPHEFVSTYRIGREQLAIFLATAIATLATDLLIGIGVGIAMELGFNAALGVAPRHWFKPHLAVEPIDESSVLIKAKSSATFSNWIPFRTQLTLHGLRAKKNIVLDLTDAPLIDHSAMEKLQELEREFADASLSITLLGLDTHAALSRHPAAARRLGLSHVKRLTVFADPELAKPLTTKFKELGASGYTVIDCMGAGDVHGEPVPQVQIEVIAAPALAKELVDYLRREIVGRHHVAVCVEAVDVLRSAEHYDRHD